MDSKKSQNAYRTISEVSKILKIQPHILRFWESRFTQISPLKRAGGRRYYSPEDIQLLRRISDLLYKEGYTIKGVQRLMRKRGSNVLDAEQKTEDHPMPTNSLPPVLSDRHLVLDPSNHQKLENLLQSIQRTITSIRR